MSLSGCNCRGHSDSCHFDAALYEATGGASGGVCDDCRNDRTGSQCERCRPFLYQDPQRATDDPHACIRTLQLLSFIFSDVCVFMNKHTHFLFDKIKNKWLIYSTNMLAPPTVNVEKDSYQRRPDFFILHPRARLISFSFLSMKRPNWGRLFLSSSYRDMSPLNPL